MAIVEEILKIFNQKPEFMRIKDAPDRIDKLEEKISKLEKMISGSGDLCKFCKKPTAQLDRIEPHRNFGHIGVQDYHFKCTECDKTWVDMVRPKKH